MDRNIVLFAVVVFVILFTLVVWMWRKGEEEVWLEEREENEIKEACKKRVDL